MLEFFFFKQKTPYETRISDWSSDVCSSDLYDVAAGVHEVLVQASHRLRMLEHDLRHEGAGLQVAAALQLEEIALGADHRALRQAFEKAALAAMGRCCVVGHLGHLLFHRVSGAFRRQRCSTSFASRKRSRSRCNSGRSGARRSM